MTAELDEILDDVFHGVAFAAFVEQARLAQTWPDSEAVKRHAYRLYEATVAERNADRVADDVFTEPA